MSLRQRLRSVLWRVPVEQEVREELDHHLELRARELVEHGLSPADARAEAERRFGDVQRVRTTLVRLGERRNRALAISEWLAELGQDIRFAWRQGLRTPGFTAGAVLTLALGIGATTAIFSVVHAVILKPFPFADPDRVLLAYTTWQGNRGSTSAGNFHYIRSRTTTLAHLAAAQYLTVNLADEGTPERLVGLRTTSNYFAVFGVPPLHGRTYTADEDRPGRAGVVVLSHQLWQRRYGGDATLVGRQIRLNGEPYDVIGVMPASFGAAAEAGDLWMPIAFTPERLAMHDEHYLELYGRRRADVTLAQVNEELDRVASGLNVDHPRENHDRGAGAQVFGAVLVDEYRTRLFVLLAAVVAVLLIACGNVANLLLSRLAARSRELAVRAAIGAGRGRIIRQLLTESFVLTALGGIAGLIAAYWLVPALVATAPADVPRLSTASLNPTVVGAALALILASAIGVGFLPAWHATARRRLECDLGDSRNAGSGSLTPWVRQTLIAAQAAIVLVVLAGAALLVRSAINLQQVPMGFDTANVLGARVALPAVQYQSPAAVQEAFRQLRERLAAAPGVAIAALDSQPPLSAGGGSNGLIPEGQPISIESVIPSRAHFITPDYFRLLRIPLVAGRAFADADVRSAPLVMIVNESLARQAFPGENAIGKRLACCEGEPDRPGWKVIVGIVGDVRARGPAESALPEFFLPVAQIPDAAWSWVQNTMNVLVRPVGGDPAALAGAIRDAVRAIDPTLPVWGMRTMDEGLRRTMAEARFNTMLMTLLGLAGLVLAALGIYSVVAWIVARRTREIGLRMALGAPARRVASEVILQGLWPVMVGLGVGAAGALATGRLLEGQLFQVQARDPATLLLVIGLMVLVAATAAIVPAWRAATIDPASALRDA